MLDKQRLEELVSEDKLLRSISGTLSEKPHDFDARKNYGRWKASKDPEFINPNFYLGGTVDLGLAVKKSGESFKKAHGDLMAYCNEHIDGLFEEFSDKELFDQALGLDKTLMSYEAMARNNDFESMRKEIAKSKVYDEDEMTSLDSQQRIFDNFMEHYRVERSARIEKLVKGNGQELDREKVVTYLKENVSEAPAGIKDHFYTGLAYGAVDKK